MDYEEKYKAALERARALNDGKDVDVEAGTTTCEYIFPELKEKESKDDRTRKAILTGLIDCRDAPDLGWSDFGGINIDECIAWIEKQGEPEGKENDDELTWLRTFIEEEAYYLSMDIRDETDRKKLIKLQNVLAWLEKQSEKDSCIGCTNDKGCVTCENGNLKEIKIEQKFKVGDWIANGGANPCYVKSIFGDYYELCSCEGFEYTKPIIDVNYIYHLWSIQDAKDGDILVASDGSIFLFAGVDDCACKYYAALTTDNYFKINKEAKGGYWETSRAIYPATKEQRDLLFQKMADAGYEWDSKKKELKKIETTAWSEEDEKIALSTEQVINCASLLNIVPDKMERIRTWLKTLKQRI